MPSCRVSLGVSRSSSSRFSPLGGGGGGGRCGGGGGVGGARCGGGGRCGLGRRLGQRCRGVVDSHGFRQHGGGDDDSVIVDDDNVVSGAIQRAEAESGVRSGSDLSAVSRRAALTLCGAAAVLAAPTTAMAFQTRADDEARIAQIADEIKQLPANPADDTDDELVRRDALTSEEAGLRNDLARLDSNRAYVQGLRQELQLGIGGYAQSCQLRVPSLEAAEAFWCGALGMDAFDRRKDDEGRRLVSVSYGPVSLDDENGAHFSINLVEDTALPTGPAAVDADQPGDPRVISLTRPGLAYIQVAVPNPLRITKVFASEAEILWGYGYFELALPLSAGGGRVRAYAGKARRDPVELLSYHVENPKAAAEELRRALPGLEVLPLAVYDGKNRGPVSPKDVGNVYIPRPPKGSVLLGYAGANESGACVMLEPMQKPSKGAVSTDPTDGYDGIDIVSGAEVNANVVTPAVVSVRSRKF
ncbi:hypothetical protein RI054_19g85480 [Pseudoscourfieldia marina]